eukprot:10650447-Prorocentrum_lima.AAC.1
MKRWQCKSRWWFVGIAGSAQGKSPCLTPYVELFLDVLKANAAWAPGSARDNHHVEGGGRCSTAAAVDKLRSCDGYLLLQADEAGALLDPAFVSAGKSDRAAVVDLTYFLNTAHGGSFSNATLGERQKRLKFAPPPPQAPATEPETGLVINPTNVSIVWLQQEQYLASWWTAVADQKPIGLVQRFLFGFATAQATGSEAHT